MAYEVKGVVHQIDPEQTFASGFTKRMIVIKTDEKYAQTVPIEFFKDDVIKVEKLKLGQEVTVHFNLRGSEHNGRFYCNLQGWKIDHHHMNDVTIPKPLDPCSRSE
jgi:hypothetical protein